MSDPHPPDLNSKTIRRFTNRLSRRLNLNGSSDTPVSASPSSVQEAPANEEWRATSPLSSLSPAAYSLADDMTDRPAGQSAENGSLIEQEHTSIGAGGYRQYEPDLIVPRAPPALGPPVPRSPPLPEGPPVPPKDARPPVPPKDAHHRPSPKVPSSSPNFDSEHSGGPANSQPTTGQQQALSSSEIATTGRTDPAAVDRSKAQPLTSNAADDGNAADDRDESLSAGHIPQSSLDTESSDELVPFFGGAEDLLGPRASDIPPSSSSSSLDLLDQLPNMYRLLDLVLERRSGGLVSKVIINQDSLSHLINALSPGAYVSLTKVNFAALDKAFIKPVGIYGSKSEIVTFLRKKGAVSDHVASLLLKPPDDRTEGTQPFLKSGLYFLLGRLATDNYRPAYVIYWPEETTWDDNAVSSVSKNRVTFMRYLSKLVDQTVALISPEHAASLVWKTVEAEASSTQGQADDDDDQDRVFSYEVAKTKDEEENVTLGEGFTFAHNTIRPIPATAPSGWPSGHGDKRDLETRIISGEASFGYLTAEFRASALTKEQFSENLNAIRLEYLLTATGFPITLPQSLSEEVLEVLLQHGLRKRWPQLCAAYEKERTDTRRAYVEQTALNWRRMEEENTSTQEQMVPGLTDFLVKQASDIYS